MLHLLDIPLFSSNSCFILLALPSSHHIANCLLSVVIPQCQNTLLLSLLFLLLLIHTAPTSPPPTNPYCSFSSYCSFSFYSSFSSYCSFSFYSSFSSSSSFSFCSWPPPAYDSPWQQSQATLGLSCFNRRTGVQKN